MPGMTLMLQGLHKNTSRLPQVQAEPVCWPLNTQQAISTGVYLAQVGAVERYHHQVQDVYGPTHLIVCGGHAKQLAQAFPQAVIQPYWVLEGVRVWALMHIS